jgi:hypothetical protein
MACMWFESARGTFCLGSNEAGVENIVTPIVRMFLIYTICCVSTTSQDTVSWKHGLRGSYSKHENNFSARIFSKQNLEHWSRVMEDTVECISGKWILKIWNDSGSITIICSASIEKATLGVAPRQCEASSCTLQLRPWPREAEQLLVAFRRTMLVWFRSEPGDVTSLLGVLHLRLLR